MAVRLKTGPYWYPIGSEELLHAFFSTIAYHLEENQWGSKYPSIMKELFQGQIHNNIDHALYELNDIKCKFGEYTIDKIVWDINDPTRRPPWKDDITEDIIALSNNFILIDGGDLFDVLENAFHKAREIGKEIKIIASDTENK